MEELRSVKVSMDRKSPFKLMRGCFFWILMCKCNNPIHNNAMVAVCCSYTSAYKYEFGAAHSTELLLKTTLVKTLAYIVHCIKTDLR